LSGELSSLCPRQGNPSSVLEPLSHNNQKTVMPLNAIQPTKRRVSLVAAGLCAGGFLAGPATAQDATTEEKKPLWETSANVGVSLTRGNSKNFLATAGVNSSRKWTRDEVLLGASAAYGKTTAINRTDGAPDPENRTESYAKGFGQYNHLFTQRLYGAVRVDALNDEIADVHYRFTVSPLVGYYFIKTPSTTLSGDIGPSYIVEKVGFSGARGYAGIRAGERFEHKFKSGARVWQTADITPEIENWENYVFNFEIGAEAPLTKKLSVQAKLMDTYDPQPPPNRLKNDMKVIAGLAYKF
jgi:putative salt-induced outer membrane protein YdiY